MYDTNFMFSVVSEIKEQFKATATKKLHFFLYEITNNQTKAKIKLTLDVIKYQEVWQQSCMQNEIVLHFGIEIVHKEASKKVSQILHEKKDLMTWFCCYSQI